MKKFKLLSIALLLISMGITLTACPSPDPDPDPGSNQYANLVGEWFLISQYGVEGFDDNWYETWDFNNQTKDGTDGSGPEKLVITRVSDNVFEFAEYEYNSYNNKWEDFGNIDRYYLDGMVLDEGSDSYHTWKLSISKSTKNELIINWLSKSDTYENYNEDITSTYKRIK